MTATEHFSARKVALITGITGQDGSYLAEYLLDNGYEVHGIIRRASTFNTGRINHLYRDPHLKNVKLFLHYGDLSDSTNLARLIEKIQPTEVYNLGAQSHVKVSFEMSEYTADVDGIGCLRILNAIVTSGLAKKCRFYQASTSELFGKVQEIPQTEKTPFYPRSPYGVAKLYAYWIVVNYREAYGIHASNGILFNHESPRRGPTFVTRKITRAVAAIDAGLQECLFLGNLDAKRDWGHARDYVIGMHKIINSPLPADDYVLATNETHTVREFCDIAFSTIGITMKWIGKGVKEIGVDSADESRILVQVDPKYFRPTEVELLIGNPAKAKEALGWEPTTKFKELVEEMMKEDIAKTKRHGHINFTE